MVLHTGDEKSSDHAKGSLIQIRLLTRDSKMRKELVALFCSIHDYQDSNSRRGGGGGDDVVGGHGGRGGGGGGQGGRGGDAQRISCPLLLHRDDSQDWGTGAVSPLALWQCIVGTRKAKTAPF